MAVLYTSVMTITTELASKSGRLQYVASLCKCGVKLKIEEIALSNFRKAAVDPSVNMGGIDLWDVMVWM